MICDRRWLESTLHKQEINGANSFYKWILFETGAEWVPAVNATCGNKHFNSVVRSNYHIELCSRSREILYVFTQVMWLATGMIFLVHNPIFNSRKKLFRFRAVSKCPDVTKRMYRTAYGKPHFNSSSQLFRIQFGYHNNNYVYNFNVNAGSSQFMKMSEILAHDFHNQIFKFIYRTLNGFQLVRITRRRVFDLN